jgi:hypothetical protein
MNKPTRPTQQSANADSYGSLLQTHCSWLLPGDLGHNGEEGRTAHIHSISRATRIDEFTSYTFSVALEGEERIVC